MLITILFIVFVCSGMILIVIPYLHFINRSRIEKANFYEEEFDYKQAAHIKVFLDVCFKFHLMVTSISLILILTNN